MIYSTRLHTDIPTISTFVEIQYIKKYIKIPNHRPKTHTERVSWKSKSYRGKLITNHLNSSELLMETIYPAGEKRHFTTY